HSRHLPSFPTRRSSDLKEPWTWVRTQGKGRVFYTAWGHDDRTWGNPGFQELIERGIRWSVGQDPTKVTRTAKEPTPTPPVVEKRSEEHTSELQSLTNLV